ncbi:XdhC family protein [Alteribacter populi]|uniref:XdhC family protein n=1 Tax=Alteribacter populi TaxID=2011011 RepID=UPI000BBB5DD1|nr:XdhC family protein [Alteribacter populi]
MLSEELVQKLSKSIEKRINVALITVTKHPDIEIVGSRSLLWDDGTLFHGSPISVPLSEPFINHGIPLMTKKKTKSIQFEWQSNFIECYVEMYEAPPHLIITGAGHVGEPVAKLGKMLNFYVTVVDDRTEFANQKKFPDVDEVVCCDSFLSYFNNVPISSRTYVLLLTRGHQFDVMSLQELLKRKESAGYIGMIGSRRRIAGVFEQLRDDFPDETFDNIFTPVGIDIGAQTPEEISVSIMAEILKVKNNTSGQSLSESIRRLAKLGFK